MLYNNVYIINLSRFDIQPKLHTYLCIKLGLEPFPWHAWSRAQLFFVASLYIYMYYFCFWNEKAEINKLKYHTNRVIENR